MGTYPKYHFLSILETYKSSVELSMKQVKDLFDIGYNHIEPYKNIKLYNKIINDFIDHYNLKVS
jgi:hypothetical protein